MRNEAPEVRLPGPLLGTAMFAIYQLDRDMSGAWRQIAVCDTWDGILNFVDSYYKGYRTFAETYGRTLPCPHDFEAAFSDVHGNVYVIYELPSKKYSAYYPDIDEDYTDDYREYLALRYYDDPYYDNYMDVEAARLAKEDRIDCMMNEEYDAFVEYLDNYSLPLQRADRQNSWYVGALHGF